MSVSMEEKTKWKKKCFSCESSAVDQRWKEQEGARAELLFQIMALFLNLLVSVAGLLGAFSKKNRPKNNL